MAPPAGRAERLGLAAPGRAGSHAEALPSRIAVRQPFGWWAVTRQDVREHLPQVGRGARLPGTGRLEHVQMLADPGALPPPPTVID